MGNKLKCKSKPDWGVEATMSISGIYIPTMANFTILPVLHVFLGFPNLKKCPISFSHPFHFFFGNCNDPTSLPGTTTAWQATDMRKAFLPQERSPDSISVEKLFDQGCSNSFNISKSLGVFHLHGIDLA